MTFNESYSDGCVVHHINNNKTDNRSENLMVMKRGDHVRMHVDKYRLANYVKEHGPANKGVPASDEFRDKCRVSALKRWSSEDATKNKFSGNQFVDGNGNKKRMSSEKFEEFRKRCREGALNRRTMKKK